MNIIGLNDYHLLPFRTIAGTLCMRIVDGVAVSFSLVSQTYGFEYHWAGPNRDMLNYLEANGFTFTPQELDYTNRGYPQPIINP